MKTLLRRSVAALGPATVVVAATDRSDGDFHGQRTAPAVLARRQRATNGRTWVMVDQVHGAEVCAVDATSAPADAIAIASECRADVIAATSPVVPVAVSAADCAPLVLLGSGGAVVIAHAGWRGLAAGIVDVAVRELFGRDDAVVAAVVGPVIRPCCYEFGADELALVALGVRAPHDAMTARTASGARALDVPAAIASALRRHGIELDAVGCCTSCTGEWFSHRRGDEARQAVVVWQETPRPGPDTPHTDDGGRAA